MSSSAAVYARVLIIGLDGATWDLFGPWIEAGLLPNLKRLRDQGAWGELRSTVPPLTAPAWATFQTGVDPGTHGITDFTVYRPGTYETTLLSRLDLTLPTLWRILSDVGRRVIVINVPITYPPEPVNGLLISGLMTPSTRVQFTHPPALAEELTRAVGEYPIFTPLRRVDVMGALAFVDRLIDTIKRRAEAAQYLTSHYPWDFAMVHFQSTDVIQHTLYSYLDPQHALHGNIQPEDRERVMRFYYVLDELLGRIIENAGRETLCLVVSDHGFGPLSRRIYLNRILADEGLLALRAGGLGLRAVSALETAVRRLDVLNLRRLMTAHGAADEMARKARGLSLVEWSRTQVYALPGFVYGRLYVNRVGREPQGIVADAEYNEVRDRVARQILSRTDPSDGRLLFERVLRREEVYRGPRFDLMPDLIAIPAAGYMTTEAFRGRTVVEDAPSMLEGSHRINGVVVLSGAGVRKGQQMEVTSIADIAPTVLWALGVPVPQYMDGAPISAAFAPTWLEMHPAARGVPGMAEARESTQAYTADELSLVEQRLRGLGYLG